MSPQGEYEPSPWPWVRDQVETYERTGGREGNTFMDTGLPVVLLTTRGRKTGKLRKSPLMRVEHNGEYALVASKGGMAENPLWHANLIANPDEATLQDGPEPFTIDVREVEGEERASWWTRAVEAYPPYAEYQEKADRIIPVVIVRRRPT
jgi:deazaflavin-dependent oxidoreductase (nitroreductase family)